MAENKQVWNKLGVSGTYRGHPSGPFSLSAQTFSEIQKNFKADNIPIPIDWDHAMEQPVNESLAKATGSAPAAGWIRDVEARADGSLWGLTEWLPETRKKILSGEYKFVSPAIRFGAVDGVTGKNVGAKLSSAAVTNRPFLKSLPPLQANDATGAFLCSEVTGDELITLTASGGYAMSQNQFLPAFRRILGLDDMASPDVMMDKLDRLSELCDMADGDPNAVVQGVSLSNYIPSLRDFMRMPANTTIADMLDAVCDMVCSTMQDSEGADMADILSAEAPIIKVTEETSPAPVIAKETITTMSDATILLSEHTVKLSEAVANAVAQATAPLTLQLKDAESKVATALAEATSAAAKVVELSDQIKTRDAAVQSDRVAEAFDTYKDTKKLSDDDREAMALTLSANPVLFNKLYPKLTADKAILLRTVTASDTTGGASKVGSVKTVPALSALLADVQAKNPSLNYDKQFDMALKEQAKLMSAV